MRKSFANIRLTPLITEKSTKLTKDGGYTFLVSPEATKMDIKKEVEEVFGVHPVAVRTANYKGGKKRTIRGQVRTIKAVKKTVVYLKEGEKIELFEEKKEKKAKKGSK